MYVIYKDLSMLTGQTSLPPNQPTGLTVKNVHNLDIFQPILLKFGMQSVNGGTHRMYESWTTLLLNPTLPKDESLWSY